MVGNFIADGLTATDANKLPASIKAGISLHHQIDAFTDSHPCFKHSKSVLYPVYKHYSSVLVDIFYDHILAIHWHMYATIPLLEFSTYCMQVLNNHLHTLPPKSVEFLQYIKATNSMPNYGDLKVIERVLKGMSQRATFESNMQNAVYELKLHFRLFEDDFLTFFPDIFSYVGRLKQSLAGL